MLDLTLFDQERIRGRIHSAEIVKGEGPFIQFLDDLCFRIPPPAVVKHTTIFSNF